MLLVGGDPNGDPIRWRRALGRHLPADGAPIAEIEQVIRGQVNDTEAGGINGRN